MEAGLGFTSTFANLYFSHLKLYLILGDFKMVKFGLSLVTLFCALGYSAQASKYKNVENCGTAKVVSGDTCSNVKVEFDLSGCLYSNKSVITEKVSCKDKTITAKVVYENYRYLARFLKIENRWGDVSWKSEGNVEQAVHKAPVKPSEPTEFSIVKPDSKPNIIPMETPPVISSLPIRSVTNEASSTVPEKKPTISFSGYLDTRLSTLKNVDSAGTNGNPESGFLLDDGAFYIGFEEGDYSVTIDVPFRRAKPVDADSNPVTSNVSATSKVNLGVDKTQMYGRIKFLTGLGLNVGQWDTPYGLELNDSKDRLFLKTGLIYDSFLPVTHSGVVLDYSSNGFVAKLLAANSNNKGSLGSSTTGDNSYEYGATFGFANDTYRSQIGVLTRPILKAEGTKFGSRTLLDLTAGFSLGKFTFDIELCNLNDESKNTLTSSDSLDSENAAKGGIALLSYLVSEKDLVGLRVEEMVDDPLLTRNKKSTSSGVMFRHKASKIFEARIEFGQYLYTDLSEVKTEQNRFSLAGLFYF